MAMHAKHMKLTSEQSALPQSRARGVSLAFIAVCLVVMLVPSIGMLFAPTTVSTENRTLAPAPTLFEDGVPNVDFLQDCGAFFDDHFALRNELVDANARLRAILGASANDQVILGSDGWLFYMGTAKDYAQLDPLSERALFNIAHNLSLMANYAESRGAAFVFAVAPNKNSLYPEYMPSYYERGEGFQNWSRLKPYLESLGVEYVDWFEILQSAESQVPLYYRQDTHWNNEGALLAANALLGTLGREGIDVSSLAWTNRTDWIGDIATMLYPISHEAEEASYIVGMNDGKGLSGEQWKYAEGAAVEDDSIIASSANENATGTLLMYRDSFGNALIPLLSPQFRVADYTKLVPYSLADIDISGAEYVVVERAERHIDYLGQHPFIMYAPSKKVPPERLSSVIDIPASNCPVEIVEDNGLYLLQGRIEPSLINVLGPRTIFYIAFEGPDGDVRLFEGFTLSQEYQIDGQTLQTDYGFAAYLPEAILHDGTQSIMIVAENEGSYVAACRLQRDELGI